MTNVARHMFRKCGKGYLLKNNPVKFLTYLRKGVVLQQDKTREAAKRKKNNPSFIKVLRNNKKYYLPSTYFKILFGFEKFISKHIFV